MSNLTTSEDSQPMVSYRLISSSGYNYTKKLRETTDKLRQPPHSYKALCYFFPVVIQSVNNNITIHDHVIKLYLH